MKPSSHWNTFGGRMRHFDAFSSSPRHSKALLFSQHNRLPFLRTRTIHLPQRAPQKQVRSHSHPEHQNRQQPSEKPATPFDPPSVLNSTLFLVLICGGSYWIGSYLTHRSTHATIDRCHSLNLDPNNLQSSLEIRGRAADARVREAVRLGIPQRVLEVYSTLEQWFVNTTSSERAVYSIIALNTLVFLAWRLPGSAKSFMHTHFTHSSLSGREYTLLTSCFSHQGVIHFAFNNIGLFSFGPAAFTYLHFAALTFPNIPPTDPRTRNEMLRTMNLDPEVKASSSYWHALAFWLSAGTISSYIPHLVNIRYHFHRTSPADLDFFMRAAGYRPYPGSKWAAYAEAANKARVTATSSSSSSAGRSIPGATTTQTEPVIVYASMGASGALYSLIAISALAFPQQEVQLIFLPGFSIPIRTGVGALVAVDALGVVRGWRQLGHLAHLSGALVGGMSMGYRFGGGREGKAEWRWYGEAGIWRWFYGPKKKREG